MRYIPLILFICFAFTGIGIAGSTYVDVPVTTTYAGGCVISTQDHNLGEISTTINVNGVAVSDYTLIVECTSGILYTITAETISNLANGDGKVLTTALYRDVARTSQVTSSSKTFGTGTGAGRGNALSHTVYPKLFGKLSSTGGTCTYTAPNYYCAPGSYSGTMHFMVSY